MYPYTPSGMSPDEIVEEAIEELAWMIEEGVVIEVAEYEPGLECPEF